MFFSISYMGDLSPLKPGVSVAAERRVFSLARIKFCLNNKIIEIVASKRWWQRDGDSPQDSRYEFSCRGPSPAQRCDGQERLERPATESGGHLCFAGLRHLPALDRWRHAIRGTRRNAPSGRYCQSLRVWTLPEIAGRKWEGAGCQ